MVRENAAHVLKRIFDPAEPEWMDRPQPVSVELLSDLRNLLALNRYFGSYRLIRHFLRRWIQPNDQLRVLDLATGSGDIPRVAVEFARKRGAQLQVDAVDFQESTIKIARELSVGFPEITFHCADIHHFGEEQDYDLVLFSLALHHFDEKEAVTLLRRCRALSPAVPTTTCRAGPVPGQGRRRPARRIVAPGLGPLPSRYRPATPHTTGPPPPSSG